MGKVVAKKRRVFEEWLQRRDRVTYDRYRAQRVLLKWVVQVAKIKVDWQWGESVAYGVRSH